MKNVLEMVEAVQKDQRTLQDLQFELRHKKAELASALLDEMGPEALISTGVMSLNFAAIRRVFRRR